ncbi:hypothetical protein ACFQE1_02150 [Halobium palmae]|uniref:Uncharacterized protein n=1 Tax=Halobium palmae TaxID=1776492 RepID=A0ABD5RW72_9EURY
MVDADELSDVSTEDLADAYVQIEALTETLEVIFTSSDSDSVEDFLREIGANSNEIREVLEDRGVNVGELHRFAQDIERPSDSPLPVDSDEESR